MPQSDIKIARKSVPLDDSDYDIEESIWYSSVSSSYCHRQLRVRPRGVKIDLLSAGELILELLCKYQKLPHPIKPCISQHKV
jgi:hypothetical protein